MDEKVVLITGGGAGIGRAMAEEFFAEGASIAALDVDLAAAEETVARLGEPDRGLAVATDVSDWSSVSAAVDAVLGRFGRIDVLCNNAGIMDNYVPAHEVPLEEWNRVIAVNLTGPFLVARAVIPTMLRQGEGAIVNTASLCAISAGGAGPCYTSSKHGILGLTRQLTFDYGKHGIRVNAICPGSIETGMNIGEGASIAPGVEEEIARTPAGRWGQPWEIARMAVYLAGEEAGFIHGTAMVIDGGWFTAGRNPL
ncbi:MAG: glucose 1-dehydrogenase [Actinobacteria bacterium]|nr:glucose 1-dehydrogenase [Actinomycetota bacterium]